ncbi:MAG TPA: NAD(P)H-dependent oxidoreductase subunit E [Nitrospira sp.]|nr:NAD(P)H-dependent oxidoreductase subunit E [Nitrospira sp.]
MSKHPPTPIELIESCRPQPMARPNVLKTLLVIQQTCGHVPVAAVQEVARVLGVTEADVAGVLSYYPDLRTAPPARHVIRVCMGESCTANHCAAVLRAVVDSVGQGNDGTASDARFTVEKVYCMGNCALSPTVVVGQDVYGRVEPLLIPSILERYR